MALHEDFVIETVSSSEEMEAVARLRYQVHVEELGKRPSGADHESKLLTDDLDSQSEIIYARRGDEVVATLRTLYGDSGIPPQYRIYFGLEQFGDYPDTALCFYSRLMIKKEFRRGGLLNDILLDSYLRTKNRGMQVGFIGCAPSLIPLYEMLGFRRYKSGIFRTDLGNDFAMAFLGDDVDYMKQIGSPFTAIAERFPVGVDRTVWFNRRFSAYSAPTSGRMVRSEQYFDMLAQHVNLREIDLVQGIEAKDLDSLMKLSVVLDLVAGDIVVKEGDRGTELFIILSGSVEVQTQQTNGQRLSLETLGNGQVFGEMSFISGQPRSADVICTSDSRLLALSQGSLEKLTASQPAVSSRLLLNLSKILIEKIHLSRSMLKVF